jgi:hypothetical protein
MGKVTDSPGFQAARHQQRAAVAPFQPRSALAPSLASNAGGHLAPQRRDRVKPAAAVPHRFDRRRARHSTARAALPRKGEARSPLRFDKHPAPGISRCGCAPVAGRVAGAPGARGGTRTRTPPLGRGVFQPVFQHRARQARIDIVQRDERVVAGDLDRQRQVGVAQANHPKGIFAPEGAFALMLFQGVLVLPGW